MNEYRKELLESVRQFDDGKGFERDLIEAHPDPRLQQLREDFEAARDKLAEKCDRDDDWKRLMDRLARDGFSHPTWSMNNSPDEDRMVNAAWRYIIARDFKEFDPKKAEMIWKLREGGAQ